MLLILKMQEKMEKDLHSSSIRILILFLIAISLVSFVTNFVKAESVNVEYPGEVRYNEEFDVVLTLNEFDEGIYDVKIDISSDKRLSKILNGNSWKSTFSYIIGAINLKESDSKTFKLKIIEDFDGEANLEVKIRKEKKVYTFSNYTIIITGKSLENNISQDNDMNTKNDYANNVETNVVEDKVKGNDMKNGVLNTVSENSIIRLGKTQDIKNKVIYESNNEIIKKIAMYGFSILCVVLVILLAWRKL